MKHQYVGDINDYRKYGVLRSLASAGWRIGICWMVTPDDARSDGRKIDYLSRPDRWRPHDADLFDSLAASVHGSGGRHLRHIQTVTLFPRTLFFDEVVPDELPSRRRWFRDAMEHLSQANLLFFDPDNGLEIRSKPMGRKGSSKYVYLDEVAAAWKRNTSLLIYQHFPRERRVVFIRRMIAQLQNHAPGGTVFPLVTSNVLFLLICQPLHIDFATHSLEKIRNRWGDQVSVFDELSPNNAMQGTVESGASLAFSSP